MTAQMDEARRRSCVQRERIRRKLFPRSVWLLGCLFFMYGLWFGVGGLVAAGRNFNKYKQAAFCYEELILSHPMVPLYDLAYADVWTSVLCMCMDVVVRFVKIKMEGHWDTYKQAAFCYEELILSHPMVPLYDLAYADGYNPGHGQNRHGGYNFKNKSYHRKWENNGAKHDKEKHGNPPKNVENACYRCGMTGHWEHTCRTARHLVDLYQASLKEKGKNIESNNVLVNDDFDITYLDVEDFLGPIEKKD
nr:Retrovirus-related Pol polyprotein from transposon TNT 1-94 [Ipomoea batatas]